MKSLNRAIAKITTAEQEIQAGHFAKAIRLIHKALRTLDKTDAPEKYHALTLLSWLQPTA